MSVRTAQAVWNGTLKDGNGNMKVGSTAFDVPFSFSTRFEDEPGTNPEELIGAAHSGCFSMFLSALLTNNETPPTSVSTTASVTLGKDDTGPVITKIVLDCEAVVPGVDADKFAELAATAKEKCPISRALGSVGEIVLNATLN